MADNNAPLMQQQFDIAKTEWKNNVQPYGVPDNFGRKTVIFEQLIWGFHATIMPQSFSSANNLTMPLTTLIMLKLLDC